MNCYSLSHVEDSVLLRDLAALVSQDGATTADLLAHIAEVDARRLYAEAGHSSMFAYCVDGLHLSEDATAKRIQAARAARRFPVLFTALADGRLHLTAVWLLAPHITPENVAELIEAATHRKKSEIEDLVVRRFGPREYRVRLLTPIASPQHAPGHVGPATLDAFEQYARADPGAEGSGGSGETEEHAPGHVGSETPEGGGATEQHAPGHVEAARRFLLQLMIGEGTRDKLQHAIALLSHSVPSGDVAQVLDRALETLIEHLEKRKYGVRR